MGDSEMESKQEFGKVPLFDGNEDKFTIWWSRFMAVAKLKGFSRELDASGEHELPDYEAEVYDDTTDEGRMKKAAVRRNDVAMSCFTMAFTTEALMGLVYKAQDVMWPNGLAHKVATELKKQYRPDDRISRVEMRARLNKVHMKKGENPKVLFEQLAAVQNMFKESELTVNEEDMIAVVMGQAPKQYTTILSTEQQLRGDELMLADLERAMNYHWKISGAEGHDEDKDESTELGLSSFPGTCYKCKKQGHKAYQCKEGGSSYEGKQNNGNKGRKGHYFPGNCNNCGKRGHKKSQCWDLEENKDKRPGGSDRPKEIGSAAVEFLLMSADQMGFPDNPELLKSPCVWIADTGATTHSTPHRGSITNAKEGKNGTNITMGNGIAEAVNMVGDIAGTICDGKGRKVQTTKLTDVSVCPGAAYNLFSLTKMTKQGWTMKGDKDSITIEKGKAKVAFDIKISTANGALYCMYLKPEAEIAGVGVKASTLLTVEKAHDLLGHGDEKRTRATAKHLGWDLKAGEMTTCDGCTAGKAKQKIVPKESVHVPAKENGERVFLDISSVKQPKGVKGKLVTRHWRMMVDERTHLKFSSFHQKKSDMVEATCEQFEKWRSAKKVVKYVRCDNAGENKLLEKRASSADWKLGLEFEYTARDTPQQNHLAEIAIAVIANRGRSLMHRANVPYDLRYRLWKEAFKTATKLDGLTVMTLDGKQATRYEHWAGRNPAFANHLRIWGEAGTVKTKTKTTPKLQDKGVHCMFVGYAESHDGDCYRMWDPETKRVHETRDVIWLSRMHYEKVRDPADVVISPDLQISMVSEPDALPPVTTENVETIDEDDTPVTSAENGQVNATSSASAGQKSVTTRSGRVSKPPQRLINKDVEMGNVLFSEAEQHYFDGLREAAAHERCENEMMLVGAGLGGGFENTTELHVMKYKEAMASADQDKWEEAVLEEHERMKKHQVWKPVNRDEVPSGTKMLTSTWAMKKKSNGTYRARLNARGFQQVEGEHYNAKSISSPVTNDVTIRIVLTLMLMAGWFAEIVDVKGAFLHGELTKEEQMYMQVPEGFKQFYMDGVVLLLQRTLYGLKQAAIAFWKELLKAMISMGFMRSKADPCLYYQWTDGGLVIWLSWIDDCLCVGPREAVLKAKAEMMKRFDCEDVGSMKEYVGCKLERADSGNFESLKMTQPVLLQSFVDEFGIEATGEGPSTPAAPGTVLVTPSEDQMLEKEMQTKYKSGVGKLLHLMRWSRPEILNAVRELSRFMSKAGPVHMKAMHRVMQYCVATADTGLLLKPRAKWDGSRENVFTLRGSSDSNYATDPETRKSVSGYSVFLEESPVAMKSLTQKSVTLSVTEAELYAATLCAQEILHVMRIMESIGLKVQKPIVLEVDNEGAVDLVNNWSVGGRTKHIEVRQYFLRELKEEGIIETKWKRGSENESDLFTKNLPSAEFEKHAKKFAVSKL